MSVIFRKTTLSILCSALLAATALSHVAQASSSGSAHQVAEIHQGQNRFGLDLFQRLYLQDPDKNLFISPTSIYLALAMLYNGAEGQTRLEMAKVLHVEGITQDKLNMAAQSWLQHLGQRDRQVILEIANAIWVRQGFQLKPNYLKTLQTSFQAEAHEAPFNQKTLNEINTWVRKNTHDKIPKILEQLEPDLMAVLLNAIYFKGEWQTAFDSKQTRPQSFRLDSGKEQEVPMMQRSDKFEYLENAYFQILRLPYGKKDAVDMVIFLPQEGQSLKTALPQLNAQNWLQWQSQFKKKQGFLMLPRFKMEYTQLLNEPLKMMGMPSVFAQANFKRMAEKPVQISYVLHKSFVEVNEKGTEAAAVTAIGMRVTSVDPNRPFVFKADHPFAFAIVDRKHNDLLFLGALVKPS